MSQLQILNFLVRMKSWEAEQLWWGWIAIIHDRNDIDLASIIVMTSTMLLNNLSLCRQNGSLCWLVNAYSGQWLSEFSQRGILIGPIGWESLQAEKIFAKWTENQIFLNFFLPSNMHTPVENFEPARQDQLFSRVWQQICLYTLLSKIINAVSIIWHSFLFHNPRRAEYQALVDRLIQNITLYREMVHFPLSSLILSISLKN